MKKYLVILVSLLLVGCAQFYNNVDRTTAISTHLVYTAYVTWTNALQQYPQLLQYTNTVHEARLKFAASVKLVDQLNASYLTNGATKLDVQGALNTMLDSRSNLLFTYQYLTTPL